MKLFQASLIAIALALFKGTEAAPADIFNKFNTTASVNPIVDHITQILHNLPVVNETQAQIYNDAMKAGKPLMTEQEFVSLFQQKGGTYQDLVKLIYQLEGREYPDLDRTLDVKLKGLVEDYRKMGMTFVYGRSLVQQSDYERNMLPLYSILAGPSTISQEVILPKIFKMIDNYGVILPDWFPSLPAVDENIPTNLLGGWIDEPGRAPINPAIDPFYTPHVSAYIGKPHGEVLGYRRFGVSSEWVNFDRGFQFSYVSTDVLGADVVATSAVMIPRNADKKNVFSMLQYIDASGATCVPSFKLAAGFLDPSPDYFLQTNRIVNVPDHGGPNHYFSVGQSEGRFTLDSLIALDSLKSVFDIEYDRHYLYGYSGGTVPVGWALQLQSTYAPNVNIRGAAIGGVIANVTEIGFALDGTFWSGFMAPVVKSYISQYPDIAGRVLKENLRSSAALNRIEMSERFCFVGTVLNTNSVNFFDSFFKTGRDILYDPEVKRVFDDNSLGLIAPRTDIPIMVYNGIQDEIATVNSTDLLVDRWCQMGAKIDYYRVPNLGHIEALLLNEADKEIFFEKLMNDNYMPASCHSWQNATRMSSTKPNLAHLPFDTVKSLIYGGFKEDLA